MSPLKLEIYDFITCLVKEEKGKLIKLNDLFMSSNLDSLGLIFVLVELDTKYGILNNIDSGKEYDQLKLKTITLSGLIDKCSQSLLEMNKSTG